VNCNFITIKGGSLGDELGDGNTEAARELLYGYKEQGWY